MVHGFCDGYIGCNAASQGKYCADFTFILFTRYYISLTSIFHLSALIPLCCMNNLQQSLKKLTRSRAAWIRSTIIIIIIKLVLQVVKLALRVAQVQAWRALAHT